MPNFTDTGSTVDSIQESSVNLEGITPNLDDETLLRVIGTRIDNGKKFYDTNLNLTSNREDNEKRWMNRNLEVGSRENLYDFQVPYKDNRIFVSVETLVANTIGNIPVPVVTESDDTDASRELADNYGKVLRTKAEELMIKSKLQMVARHLLMGYRTGVMKAWWDFTSGRLKDDGTMTGDIAVNWVRPHKIIIDADATDIFDIPLVAEYLSESVEELGIKFPDKKDAILRAAGGKSELDILGKKLTYPEVWYTYYKEGQKREGVCWKYESTIFGTGDNPYYNYETSDDKTNFFRHPRKPYIFFNFLSIGRWVYDDTSLTEQAAELQDVLEKRGRQIVENADQANSSKVWNTQMISATEVQKYVNDPSQNIMVNGDVRMAFARVQPPLLPSYVLEDKFDARTEIDNIFGTHAPLRGEKTTAPTLGQEVMSQRSDLGRMQQLSESIEAGAVEVYKYMTQLYKVFGTEEDLVQYTSPTGDTTFVQFSGDKIEDGVKITIQAGSMTPDNKSTDKTEAIELAKLGSRIDPLTFAEKWHLPNPREFAKRLVYFMWMPDKYMADILGEGPTGQDQSAQSDIQRVNAGESVPPPQSPSKEYIATYGAFVRSPQFKQLDPEVQRLHVEHLKAVLAAGKTALGVKPQAAPPTAPQPGQGASGMGFMDKLKGLFGGGK